jgi:hypothetical protein
VKNAVETWVIEGDTYRMTTRFTDSQAMPGVPWPPGIGVA